MNKKTHNEYLLNYFVTSDRKLCDIFKTLKRSLVIYEH